MRSTVKEEGPALEGDDAQSQLLQNGGAKRGVLAAQAEVRLDTLLPDVEILLPPGRESVLPNSE